MLVNHRCGFKNRTDDLGIQPTTTKYNKKQREH